MTNTNETNSTTVLNFDFRNLKTSESDAKITQFICESVTDEHRVTIAFGDPTKLPEPVDILVVPAYAAFNTGYHLPEGAFEIQTPIPGIAYTQTTTPEQQVAQAIGDAYSRRCTYIHQQTEISTSSLKFINGISAPFGTQEFSGVGPSFKGAKGLLLVQPVRLLKRNQGTTMSRDWGVRKPLEGHNIHNLVVRALQAVDEQEGLNSSVALPLFGRKDNTMPQQNDDCLSTTLKAIADYFATHPQSHIKTIHIVSDIKDDPYQRKHLAKFLAENHLTNSSI